MVVNMFDTWWECEGLDKETAERVVDISNKLIAAGIGNAFDSILSAIHQYRPVPKMIDNLFLIDKERVRNSVNQQIKRNWKAR